MLAVYMIVVVSLVAIIIVVTNIETGPYCGSKHIEKRPADWSVRCKK